MLAQDIAESLHSPAALVAIGVIGLLLLIVMVRELRYVPSSLLVLMATAFLDMVGLLMIVPLLPFYVKRLEGDGANLLGVTVETGTLSGIVVSAFTVAQLLSAPFWGRRSDRWGRRPVLLIALGASALGYLVFGFADSLGLLMLSRLVQGAGGGTVGVIQAYVADSTEPEQRARALGWLSAATNLGVVIGPVLGSYAFKCRDVDLLPGPGTLVMGNAAPGIVAAALCLCTLGLTAKHLKESHKSVAQPVAGRPVRTSVRAAFIRVLARPHEPASRLILTYGIAIGAFQGINAVLALFLQDRFRFDEETIGYFFMYIGALAVFARVLLLGRLVDLLGEARLSRLGIVVLAAGLMTIPFAGSLTTLALAVAMLPVGTAFTFPCVTALLSRVVSGADRGLYMGLPQTYAGLARLVAPIFYGWAFDHLGIAVPFYFSGAFVLATVLLVFGLDRFAGPRKPPA